MPKIARPRPEYEALVQRIARGEITRPEAATLAASSTGLSANTFLSWLRSSGRVKDLIDRRGTVGQNSIHAHKDPDKVLAYENALNAVMGGDLTMVAAAKKFDVSYRYLVKKVHKAKENLDKALVEEPIPNLERAIYEASAAHL
jgi:hypothetical protein